MKALALVFSLIPTLASASPHTLSERLVELMPEGYSEGATLQGAPCRVIFSPAAGAAHIPADYARAQVIAEPEGNLVDLELFFDGNGGKAHGHWSRNQASVHYRQFALSVSRSAKGVLVKARNRATKLSAECLLAPRRVPSSLAPSSLALKR